MNKQEVMKEIQTIAKEHDFELTLKDVDELIKIFNETYVAIGEKLEEGTSANVGVVTVQKKRVAARSGVSKLGEEEKAWSTPEKIKIDLRAKASFVKANEQEI